MARRALKKRTHAQAHVHQEPRTGAGSKHATVAWEHSPSARTGGAAVGDRGWALAAAQPVCTRAREGCAAYLVLHRAVRALFMVLLTNVD